VLSFIKYIDLERISYTKATEIQEYEKQKVIDNKSSGSIYLLEHLPSVITLGRNADTNNIIYSKKKIEEKQFQIIETSRGGDVTIHEIGQLVIYFVLPIKFKQVKTFVLNIMNKTKELIQNLYNLELTYYKDKPGLWILDRKICSFGFDLRAKVSMHGLALNVNNDIISFNLINPCGLQGVKMTSVKIETKAEQNIKYLKEYIIENKVYN